MSQIPRLYVPAALSEGALVSLEEAQAHYVRHVLRMSEGEPVHLFNGRDGEWESRIENLGKRGAQLHCARQLRPQEPGPDLWLLFAPIKHGKIDFLAQKAVELGASRLSPVITQHTAVSRVNTERLLANAVEAAEQSGCMDVAQVDEPASLMSALQGWEEDRVLLYADESGQGLPPPRRCLPYGGANWRCSSAPKADFPCLNMRICAHWRSQKALVWARASCAPTRPLWQRWPSFRLFAATGTSAPISPPLDNVCRLSLTS